MLSLSVFLFGGWGLPTLYLVIVKAYYYERNHYICGIKTEFFLLYFTHMKKYVLHG